MSKFLSYEDRMIIAQRLQENASFGAIGKELGKDRTTIAKEIKKYSYDKKSGRPGYPYNPCKLSTNPNLFYGAYLYPLSFFLQLLL